MPIQIHGKSYNTVAERIIKAGNDLIGVETEVLSHDPVVIKATITVTKNGLDKTVINGTGKNICNICKFTGISAANANKSIEKESPYEVAETSAVGRALAFAGYETTNGIASSLEILKSERESTVKTSETVKPTTDTSLGKCVKCGADMKLSMQGKKYCSAKCWLGTSIPDKVSEEFTAF